MSDYERLVAQHIKPILGHLPVQRVVRDDVVQLHLAMKRTPRQANYVVTVLHAIFNFAEDLGLRPHGSNPAKRIKRYREGKLERFFSEDEIARVADGIDAAERIGKIGPHVACGLRLALFTGARSGEITAIQWSHIDWGGSSSAYPIARPTSRAPSIAATPPSKCCDRFRGSGPTSLPVRSTASRSRICGGRGPSSARSPDCLMLGYTIFAIPTPP